MNIIELLIKEMEEEAVPTRKMLQRVPVDKFGWKPHERSMLMEHLALHVAELPTWVSMALNTTELDFAQSPYQAPTVKDSAALMELFEKSLADAKSNLSKATESDLLPNWTLRNGEEVYKIYTTRYDVIRMAYSQIVHHRAQLGVYLRLLNIPIPPTYGPSADESGF